MRTARETSKTQQTLRNRGPFFSPTCPCRQPGLRLESAVARAISRCDSCDNDTLRFVCPMRTERGTVSRRSFCDAELLAKRYGPTAKPATLTLSFVNPLSDFLIDVCRRQRCRNPSIKAMSWVPFQDYNCSCQGSSNLVLALVTVCCSFYPARIQVQDIIPLWIFTSVAQLQLKEWLAFKFTVVANYYPRKSIDVELIRRGVIYYAVFFTPNNCSRVNHAG